MKKSIILFVLLSSCASYDLQEHLEAERAFVRDYYGNYEADYVADCLEYDDLYCPEFE